MYYPYYQMRIDDEAFHGMVCLIRMTDGEKNYWQTPKAGRIQVTGAGMTWLELIPDGMNRVVTVMYFPDGTHDGEREQYPAPADPRYRPSIWYVDIIDGMEYDEYGIAVFIIAMLKIHKGKRLVSLSQRVFLHRDQLLRVVTFVRRQCSHFVVSRSIVMV